MKHASQTTVRTKRFWADRNEQLSLSGLSIRGDWFLLVAASFLLLATLLVLSWLSYRALSKATILNAEARTATRAHVNEEQLSRVTEQYRVRTERFAEITNGFVLTGTVPPRVPDITPVATTTVATSTSQGVEAFDVEE
ncbi:MAG: hypothetical protein RL150_638 [Candidatus Parcubacteria bacterium]|jgi:hypothetical protein